MLSNYNTNKKLGYTNFIVNKWLQKKLSNAHNEKHLASCHMFLQNYQNVRNELFSSFITGDASRISYTNVSQNSS